LEGKKANPKRENKSGWLKDEGGRDLGSNRPILRKKDQVPLKMWVSL